MDKRKEYEHLKRVGALANECGRVCVSCGATEEIEYHHILPLVLGGDNRFSNIVPLCCVCHSKIHGQNHRLTRWSANTGRPKSKPPEGYEKVLPLYFDGKIAWNEARLRMGLGKGVKARDTWWVNDFAERMGIEKYEKYSIPRRSCTKPKVVAKVWYKDGRITETTRYVEEDGVKFYVMPVEV